MEKRKIKIGIILSIITLFVVLFACFFITNKKTDSKRSVSMPASRIEDIDWSDFKTEELSLTNSVTLTHAGVYHLTGNLSEGNIHINTEGFVKLIFDGISIQSNNGPALYVENAKKVEIELKGENQVSDSAVYLGLGKVNACIYSKDDLIFSGDGSLSVKGSYEVGIRTKKDLKVISGHIQISSKDDGIDAEDSFEVVTGNIEITSEKNGIKVENKKDKARGFMLVRDGEFTIKSKLDGIQTSSSLWIEKGIFDIETTGNVIGVHQDENKSSSKGLKGEDITMKAGTYKLTTTDDAIHARNNLTVEKINVTISSGDDALHAKNTLLIKDGNIDILNSYEGLEADVIEIKGGTISLSSEDDGINAAGDKPTSPREKGASQLLLQNGNIHIKANGDGIDVNGNIEMNGGALIIEGPENSGNGALDYDGEFKMNGGTLLALGSSGMAQGISENSKQVGFLSNYERMMQGELQIKTSDGKELYKISSNKSFNSVVFSSAELQKKDTIELFINQEKVSSFPLNGIFTIDGNRELNHGRGPHNR